MKKYEKLDELLADVDSIIGSLNELFEILKYYQYYLKEGYPLTNEDYAQIDTLCEYSTALIFIKKDLTELAQNKFNTHIYY